MRSIAPRDRVRCSLPGRSLGQLVHQQETSRHLEVGERWAAKSPNLRGGGGRVVSQHDRRPRRLAERRVWRRERHGFGDRRVAQEDFVHFRRRDLVPPRLIISLMRPVRTGSRPVEYPSSPVLSHPSSFTSRARRSGRGRRSRRSRPRHDAPDGLSTGTSAPTVGLRSGLALPRRQGLLGSGGPPRSFNTLDDRHAKTLLEVPGRYFAGSGAEHERMNLSRERDRRAVIHRHTSEDRLMDRRNRGVPGRAKLARATSVNLA